MALTGDWLIPRVGGEIYPDKPPLAFWLMAAAFRLTGNLRVAFLLPSLAAGLGTLVLVHDLARRLWGREAALHAALLLLFTVQFTLLARSAQLDALVAFWTTLGLYGLLRHLLLGPAWRWYFAAWFAMGLGIITKGVGFLPLLVFVPWLFARGHRLTGLARIEAPRARWWAGPLAMIAALACWLVPMLLHVAASGSAELAAYRDEILMRQTVVRYVAAWHHIQPFWYYLAEVIPWAWLPSVLLVPWLAPLWLRQWREGDAATWLLLGWAACVLVFFSVTPGKRQVYILPALPAVALAAAPHLAVLLRREPVRQLAAMAVIAVAGVALIALAWLGFIDPRRAAPLPESLDFDPLPLLAVAAAVATSIALSMRWLGGIAALALTIFAGWQLAGWWAAPLLDPLRSGSELMERVAASVPRDAELGLAGWKEQLLLHADRPVVHFGFRREPAAESREASAWLAAAPGRYLLLPASQMPPCLDPARADSMGIRHRNDWRLATRGALTGSCDGPVSSRMRTYTPGVGPR
jgi:4-amino-4-deoxy-L-arabinose transferase-like glycosyltransferase